MEDSQRTLIVLLSMHRCGSSLTTGMLHRMGMSLGPFALLDAAPSNPHGHFEAQPFNILNRRVQELAVGFPDDLPDSTEVLKRFCESQGDWPRNVRIPEELLDEGRSLIRILIASGEISGFKDPRTVLNWPFWKRVFESFPGLRIVPISLLRSPHEIAMSLVTRRNGWCGYWSSLDVVAVHLRRQKAIIDSCEQPAPALCFGNPSFLSRIEEVARRCGLTWNASAALEIFDHSCVHQVPAAIDHEAQSLFDSLCRDPAASQDPEKNRAQLVNDARFLEALRLQQWQSLAQELSDSQEQTRRATIRADQVSELSQELETRLADIRSQLISTQRELIESQEKRHEMQEQIIQSQARELQLRQDHCNLQDRIERFESHPILRPALQARRWMRKVLHGLSTNSSIGHGTLSADSEC